MQSLKLLTGEPKYAGILKLQLAISRRTSSRIIAKAWQHDRGLSRGLTTELLKFPVEIISAEYNLFTDEEKGIVKRKVPHSKYPVHKLHPSKYKDGQWVGDCIRLKNNEYDQCWRHWKKYYPNIPLVFRRLTENYLGCWRIEYEGKIDRACLKRFGVKKIEHHVKIPRNAKYPNEVDTAVSVDNS